MRNNTLWNIYPVATLRICILITQLFCDKSEPGSAGLRPAGSESTFKLWTPSGHMTLYWHQCTYVFVMLIWLTYCWKDVKITSCQHIWDNNKKENIQELLQFNPRSHQRHHMRKDNTKLVTTKDISDVVVTGLALTSQTIYQTKRSHLQNITTKAPTLKY